MSESGDAMDTTDMTRVEEPMPAGSATEEGARITVKAPRTSDEQERQREVVFDVRDGHLHCAAFTTAVRDVTLMLGSEIARWIGPSGCGRDHVPAMPEPDERPHRGRASRGNSEYHGQPLRR
jgi:hypothetical protein